MILDKKIKYGQFFTLGKNWLLPHIIEFIKKSSCNIAYDPFAGAGNLLLISHLYGISDTVGLDIDESLKWKYNDSLENIPHIDNAIIITNPPYLAKNSATRKKINLCKYFNNSIYDDLYLIALDKMIKAQKYIVAIIPESFINSNYKNKHLLESITILESNPFDDTEVPVCIACFNGVYKEYSDIKIYKNEHFENTLEAMEKMRINPTNDVDIKFNDLNGWLGIRAVDKTDDESFIKFDFKENIRYDFSKKIKESSRHYTLVSIDVKNDERITFVNICNDILNEIRKKSSDTILTPFMGNTKKGIRRRRLDFKLARAIMEIAYDKIYKNIRL